MAENTAAGTDQTVAIRPSAQTEQTVAIQHAAASEQTVNIRPVAATEQTVAIQGKATVAAKAPLKAIEAAPIELMTPEALPGFDDLASTWWCAVAKVHEALLSEAALEALCEVFDAELRARWEYAKTLHQEGYEVPEYLTERAAVAPLWPLPELPQPADELAHAA